LSAWRSLGPPRTILFTLVSFFIAFAAEWSSTRVGFPFGLYYYTGATRGREIFLLNVPFMDSLSFTFLSYVSFALALFFEHRVHRKASPLSPTPYPHALAERTSPRVLLFATLFFVMIDLVIDPLAVRGDRWFLGEIFGYSHPGIYFGVPLTNFLGWGVVGGATFFIFQRVDRLLSLRGWGDPGFPSGDFRDFLGPALYYLILLFNLGMTFWIGEGLLGAIGVVIYLPVTLLLIRFC
jgi:putative membrane protein